MTEQWQPPQPPPYQPPYQPVPHREPRPWWKTRWAIIAAAVLAALLLLGVGAATGTQHKVNVAGPTTHETTTATATISATVTATPTVVRTTQQVVRTTQQVQKVVATRTRVQTVTYTPPPSVAFTDGQFRVGSDVKPGTYHTDATGTNCYYERDKQGTGIDSIIENGNITGPTTIDVSSSDYELKTSGGCAWQRR